MGHILPALGQALEWAGSRAEADRLAALRDSIRLGWHSDERTGRAVRAGGIPEESRRIAATLLGER